ncbi:MAG: MYXO-CTERM sorting domain-containing protein [Polyangiales bacterium]
MSIARDAIATHLPWASHATLDLESVVPRDDGSRIVRFSQSIAGIPVEDRGARVLVDLDGVARIATALVEDRAPSALRPVLDAKGAARAQTYRGLSLDASRARLAFVPAISGPVLAWIVAAEVPWELPVRPVVAVDAITGARVFAVDRVRRAKQVRVWTDNPVKTPALAVQPLASLLDGTKVLTSASWDTSSCVDNGTVKTLSTLGMPLAMHLCDIKHAATADAAGDFLYTRPASDTAVDDPISEVSAAYHVDRALRAYASYGLPLLRPEARPLMVVANVRMPSSWTTGPASKLGCSTCKLEPLDNAFYAPIDGFTKDIFGATKDGLFLGQGSKVDYAYDGDVLYHELGHAVVETTAKLVPTLHFDEQGAIMQPGAANEGLADFLSSTVTGDPQVGEYAGGMGGAIRNLANSDACPDILTNEVHEDSLPFSGALWEARNGSADRAKFDRGVMLGLQMVPSGDVGFGELLDAIEKGLEKEAPGVDSKNLAVIASKRGLGLDVGGCKRIRELPEGGKAPWDYGFFAYGRPYAPMMGVDVVPGHVQFHRTLPADASSITVSWSGNALPGDPAWLYEGMPFDAAVLVKFDAPMKFTGGKGDWGTRRDVDGTSVFETISVPPGAKDVYVMVGTVGDGSGLYDNVTVDVETATIPPDSGPIEDTGPIVSDSGTAGDAGSDAAFEPASGARGQDDVLNGRACSCELPGGPAKGTATFALLGLSLATVARRRRRH